MGRCRTPPHALQGAARLNKPSRERQAVSDGHNALAAIRQLHALTGRSEAQESRDAFVKASAADQNALVAFLLGLRTFSPEKR